MAKVSKKMHHFYRATKKKAVMCVCSPALSKFSQLPLGGLPIILSHAGAVQAS
jgi:hypothetical protein